VSAEKKVKQTEQNRRKTNRAEQKENKQLKYIYQMSASLDDVLRRLREGVEETPDID
jgi:hypothetical protein